MATETRGSYYRSGGAVTTTGAPRHPSGPEPSGSTAHRNWISTYRSVQMRVTEFRKDHPDWSIHSELVQVDLSAGFALAYARILDESGRVRSDGFKFVSGANTPFVERAQTGAIGRALHFLGYTMQEDEEDAE